MKLLCGCGPGRLRFRPGFRRLDDWTRLRQGRVVGLGPDRPVTRADGTLSGQGTVALSCEYSGGARHARPPAAGRRCGGGCTGAVPSSPAGAGARGLWDPEAGRLDPGGSESAVTVSLGTVRVTAGTQAQAASRLQPRGCK